MSQEVVAKRYAVALFQVAKDKGLFEQMEEELRVVKQVFSENPAIHTILKHPKVSINKKKEILKESFASLSEEVVNTLLLLVDRHREDAIVEMIDYFFEQANEEQGIAEAKVYSVRELSDDEKKSLTDIFAKRIGKKTLRIENIIDKSLLGGIKLRIGNRIFDGSVSGKLDRIERQLVSTKR